MSERTIRLDGPEPEEVLQGVMRRFDEINFGRLFATFNVEFQELHEQYFLSESDPEGNPWAPLAPATVERKGHDRILQETNRLMNSLTDSGSPDAVRNFFNVGVQQIMQFGTSVEYAEVHMEGSGNIPARPMVGLSDGVVDALADQTADYVLGVMLEGAL